MTEEYGSTFTELKFIYELLLEGKDDSATIFSFIKEDPADFICILREIMQSKDISGICPACKDW